MADPTDPRVLESLRVLAGMGMSSGAQNPEGLVMGRVNQQSRLDDMKRNISKQGQGFSTGALPFDVQNLQGDLNSDTDFGTAARGRVASIEGANDAMNAYNRPDVTAKRQHDEAFKMRLEGEKARVSGEANLKAAQAAGELRNLRDMLHTQEGNANRVEVQGMKNDAAGARLTQSTGAQALRDRLKLLETGKAHAKQPGGIMGFLGGNKAADEAEIASLQQQLTAGGQDSEAPRPSQASTDMVIMRHPDGRTLHVPASRVAEAEAHGAVRM